MIFHDDKTVLTDAQLATLRAIEHGYGSQEDPGAKIEYGYCDEGDAALKRAGDQLVVLERGVKWDYERMMWVMDVLGILTIQ